MRLFLLLMAVVAVSCQNEYFILTDEITDSCRCIKFAISIAYKNGGFLKDIVEDDQNGIFVDNGVCFVKYVDRQDTFSNGGNFQVINENCLQIGTANLLSVVYNYTDTAANILSDYPSIDTSKYSKVIDQACNASASNPKSNNSASLSPESVPSASAPATDTIFPPPSNSVLSAPAPATDTTSSPPSNSAPLPSALSPASISDSETNTAASPKPSATIVTNPTPASSNSILTARPVLAWIMAFVVAVLLIGSSYADIVVVNPIAVCPGTSGDGRGQLATATQQADDGTARNALQSELLGSDGSLVVDQNPIEGI